MEIKPKILLPVDFYSTSDNTFLYAIAFAEQFNADVHILTVLEDTAEPEQNNQFRKGLKEREIELFYQQIKSYKNTSEVNLSFGLTKESFTDAIINYLQNNAIDFLIIGYDTNGIKSNSQIRQEISEKNYKVNVPIIIVPEKATFSIENNIAFDVRLHSEECELLKKLAVDFNKKGRLVHCIHIADSQKSFNEAVAKKDAWMNKINQTNLSLDILLSKNIMNGLKKIIEKYNIQVLTMINSSANEIQTLLRTQVEALTVLSPKAVYVYISTNQRIDF